MDISTLEQQVLMAALALHPNGYGIAIQDHIRRRANREPSIGSIYAAFGRLQGKGYVTTRPGEPTPERGGRRKLYVTLTASGQAALQESLRTLSSLKRGLRWREAFRSIEVVA
jgi:PadR family transcriptional regulator, regulatory protein PadR